MTSQQVASLWERVGCKGAGCAEQLAQQGRPARLFAFQVSQPLASSLWSELHAKVEQPRQAREIGCAQILQAQGGFGGIRRLRSSPFRTTAGMPAFSWFIALEP